MVVSCACETSFTIFFKGKLHHNLSRCFGVSLLRRTPGALRQKKAFRLYMCVYAMCLPSDCFFNHSSFIRPGLDYTVPRFC